MHLLLTKVFAISSEALRLCQRCHLMEVDGPVFTRSPPLNAARMHPRNGRMQLVSFDVNSDFEEQGLELRLRRFKSHERHPVLEIDLRRDAPQLRISFTTRAFSTPVNLKSNPWYL